MLVVGLPYGRLSGRKQAANDEQTVNLTITNDFRAYFTYVLFL